MASQQPVTAIDKEVDVDKRPSKILRTIKAGPSGLASVITVIVGTGDQQRTVVLHEALLRQSSVFFDNALKPEWKEAHDRAITTIETCPKSFATYAKFLFTGVIFIQPDGEIYSV